MPETRVQKTLIEKIETLRKSRLIVYVTGDRTPFGARIAEDVVRPFYDHLLALEKNSPASAKRLDLFLYSRGGDVSVPWRIVSMIRELYPEFNVLIPYKAHSAATMIALGADSILMGRKAELSPIDPTLAREGAGEGSVPPSEISVEDVSAYLAFIRERAKITDQMALAQLLGKLADNITPLVLGNINRQHPHIRLVARKLLASHQRAIAKNKMKDIVDTLVEKMYSHGHAIGRKEAKGIGLPVRNTSSELEQLLWELFELYEEELKLRDNLDPELLLQKEDEEKILTDLPVAIIESVQKLHKYETRVSFRRKRNVPGNLQVNVNLTFGLPPGLDPAQIPANIRELLAQLQQQIGAQIPALVREEMVRQSPAVGFEGRSSGGRWVER